MAHCGHLNQYQQSRCCSTTERHSAPLILSLQECIQQVCHVKIAICSDLCLQPAINLSCWSVLAGGHSEVCADGNAQIKPLVLTKFIGQAFMEARLKDQPAAPSQAAIHGY